MTVVSANAAVQQVRTLIGFFLQNVKFAWNRDGAAGRSLGWSRLTLGGQILWLYHTVVALLRFNRGISHEKVSR
jgi:hypothetical protein